MHIRYEVTKLDGLIEVDPRGVAFESTNVCCVCGAGELLDLSELNQSLTTAWCPHCSHTFHRRRPKAEWYQQWYRHGWDRQARSSTHRKPKSSLSRAARSVRRASEIIGRQLGWRAKRMIDPRGRCFAHGSIFDFCRPTLHRKAAVLDIGCGYGEALKPFLQMGCRAYGLEASPLRAEAARRLGVTALNLDVENLSTETFNRSFDLVMSNHVLEHVVDPHAFLESARRVLKPGGWLFLAVPNIEHDFLLHNFFFALHIHFFSNLSLRRLLEAHGFSIHRLLAQHELRVLAKYDGGQRAPRLQFAQQVQICPEQILAAVLGAEYRQNPSRDVTCQWNLNTRALDRRFDVRHLTTQNEPPLSGRAMRLRWDGAEEFAFQFSSTDGPAPFWVK